MRFFILATLCVAASFVQAQKQMSISLDDLPVTSYSQNPAPEAVRAQQEITRSILATLHKHHAPAIGFVNEIKLNTPGARDAYADMPQAWLDAGMELGCHGYSHLSLSDTPLPAYEADFIRGTVITPLLMKQAGKREHYYRYPFNDTGDTVEKHDGFLAYLAQQGYQPAPMTLENDDWMYAGLYVQALQTGDTALATRLRDAYLAENEQKIAFIERVSEEEFHRDIAQIADLHVNKLNADALDALLAQYEQHGYKFVSFDAALADPAYATKDMYVSRYGVSWLERWAPALGVKDSFRDDTDPPAWVTQMFKDSRKK